MAHGTENALRMTLWNCNGALWTHPGRLEEILKVSDILFLVETHQSPNRGLPRVEGFRWESAFRQTSRRHTTRGSGGVAILFRRELHNRMEIMKIDPEARFMWVKVSTSKDQAVFFAICYFPPKGSRYNIGGLARLVDEGMPHGPSPYEPLSDFLPKEKYFL